MFHDSRLNDKIEYGSSGGPMFSTMVIQTDSGSEQRIAKWSAARHSFKVGMDLNKAQMTELRQFFFARRGKLHSFPFKDWNDYKAIDQPLEAIDTTHKQMIRRYSDAGSNYDRKITKPVVSTITIKRNGSNYTDFTVARLTGIITLTGFTSGTFTWSGEFDVPVRFETDFADVTMDDFDTRKWSGLQLIEVFE